MSGEKGLAAGLAVRRAILGDKHVDRANESIKPYNRDFQDLVSRFGWGEIWTRPGLSHHQRRILVIGTMIALGKWDEFRMHVKPALASGQFSLADLSEVILQQTIYCGFPAGNTAFREVSRVLQELAAEGVHIEGADA
jgi:4-carboxymuconolactone decarboxylase